MSAPCSGFRRILDCRLTCDERFAAREQSPINPAVVALKTFLKST